MTREQLLARQQELLNAASAEQRDLTPEEQAQFDECQRQLDAMGAPENNNPNMGQRNFGGDDNGSGARPDDSEAAQRAVAAERQRVAEVTELCRSFGIDATQYVNNGSTIEQTRAAVLENLKRTHAPIGARVTQDEGDKFRAAAADGLAMRSGVAVTNAAEGAESFRNMDLRSLGQECLIRSGMDSMRVRSMSSDELFHELTRQAFNPTSAFPAIMDAAVNKSVAEMYQHAPTTFQLWVTEGSKSDFKETKDHEYVINSVGDFDEVPENGELKNSKIDTELLPTSKLKTYGTSLGEVETAFESAISGLSAGELKNDRQNGGRDTDIKVRFQGADGYKASDVARIPIISSGRLIYLGDVAEIRSGRGPVSIRRVDKQRASAIGANLSGRPIGEVMKDAREALNQADLGEGVTYRFRGQATRMDEAFGELLSALLLALVLIYMLLAVLYESVITPFIRMFSLPLGLIGSILLLLITHNTLNLYSLIGILVMDGIVAKNGTLLIDYALTLMDRGRTALEAVMEAGKVRLRPIMMTTITMMAGMLPTALSLTAGSETRSSMAWVIIGGLLTSTVFTLLVIPIIFLYFYEKKRDKEGESNSELLS